MNDVPLGERGRARRVCRYVAACACAAVLAVCALVGCAPGQAQQSASSTQASSSQQEEHAQVAVRVYAPVALEGVLKELASAYAAEKPWLSFDVQAFEDAKALAAALLPESAGSSSSASGLLVPIAAGAPSTSSSSEAASDAADGEQESLVIVADMVFASSKQVMDEAELAGVLDAGTRLDMLEDRLVLACGDEAGMSAVTTADVQAGLYRVAVVAQDDEAGMLQRDVLANLGLYADGAFQGALAASAVDIDAASASDGAGSQGKVIEAASTAAQFELLAQDPQAVGIVKASDLYRYGGVKAVGEVPSNLYNPLRYSFGLAPVVEVADNQEATQAAHDVRDASEAFVTWMISSEEAQRIQEKWGFRQGA